MATRRSPSGHDSSAASADAVSDKTPPAKPKPKYVRIITQQRREQCRRSQTKYRRKLVTDAQDLEIQVQRLRLEVLQHEDRRRTLRQAINPHESCVHVIKELCHVFQRGVNPDSQALDERQLAFMASAFHPNLRIGDWYSSEFFVEQMRRFSRFFDDMSAEMVRCWDFGAADTTRSVKMAGKLRLTVSAATIQHVFPHLQLRRLRKLNKKLLGLPLELSTCGLFVFDQAQQIIKLAWTIDFSSALQAVLTIEETAVALEHARIVQCGYLLASVDAPSVELICSGGVKDSIEAEPHSHRRREPRWYELESWSRSQQSEVQIEVGGDDEGKEEGVLIHDGKGDDFVMV